MHDNRIAGFFDSNDDNVSISKDGKHQRLNIAQPDLFIYKRRRQFGNYCITITEIKAFCLRLRDYYINKKRWLELMLEYIGTIMRNYKPVPIYIKQQHPPIYMRMRELSQRKGDI